MQFEELQFLLKKYNLAPNKLRGQNFLISDEVLRDIITAADIQKDDLILEIGSGLGALTQELVKLAGQVVSFEVDKNFVAPLKKLEDVNKNLHVYWQDILSLTDSQWQKIRMDFGVQHYKVVANIPYYLTGKVIPQFINAQFPPDSMILLVQKEVAERIVQKNNKHSLLSLAIALYGRAKIISLVSAKDFYPSPEVDSAVIKIEDIKHWSYRVEEKKVWQLIHRGFANKRKKLLNNIASDPNISKDVLAKIFLQLSLDHNIRAEDMTVKNWLDLAARL